MSDDFIFIEQTEDSDLPIIDGITYTRLLKEWEAVLIDLDSSQRQITPNVWKNVLTLFSSFYSQDEHKSMDFLIRSFGDLNQRLEKASSKNLINHIVNIFCDILCAFNKPLFFIEAKYLEIFFESLPFHQLRDLQSLLCFLSKSLEPFCADEIPGMDGFYPFIGFLLGSFDSDNEISLQIRRIIETIISTSRKSLSIFLPMFFEKIIDTIISICLISPTIYEGSFPITLLTWISDVLCRIPPKLTQSYNKMISTFLLPEIVGFPEPIRFYSIFILFAHYRHYSSLSDIVKELILPDGVFSSNMKKWSIDYTHDFLRLLMHILNLRCGALLDAFFFHNSTDMISQFFGFPDLPLSASASPEELHIDDNLPSAELYLPYLAKNSEMEMNSPKVYSILPFLLGILDGFWSLPSETAYLVTGIIERFAATCSKHAYYFCFSSGTNVYSRVSTILRDYDNGEKSLQRILRSFVIVMKRILRQNPRPL